MKTSQPEPKQNTGVLIEVRPKDYVAGFESGVLYEARNESGKWDQYRSRDELQYKEGVFDTLSCVTFATLNSIETQINYLIATGKMPEDKKVLLQSLGYLNDEGKADFNDAFTAQMSGTTKFGNFLQNPAESVRLFGVLPQKDYIQLSDCKSLDEWLDGSKITDAMKAKAKQFLDIFSFSWEWINTGNNGMQEDYVKHLKHAPLPIATGVCSGWNSEDPIKKCGLDSGHAISMMGSEDTKNFLIVDHYVPFIKHLEWDYLIKWAIKTVVTPKAKAEVPSIKYRFTRSLRKGMRGYDVMMLQRVLMLEVPETFTLKNPTDYFGDRTFAGVVALQDKYRAEILTPVGLSKGTGFVGNSTTTFLNKKYA